MDDATAFHPAEDPLRPRALSQTLIRALAQDQPLPEILDSLLAAVEAEKGLILLKGSPLAAWSLAAARGYPDSLRLDPRSAQPLVGGRLETILDAAPLRDFFPGEAFPGQRDGLMTWMMEQQVVWVIPILCPRELVGILGLGLKQSQGEYSREEIQFLQTWMIPTALAIQTARQEAAIQGLGEVIATKDKFLSILAHDLRTPMTGIKGYASILRRTITGESQKKYLEIIVTQVDRLSQMINVLLDILRYEEGRMQLQFKPLDLNQLLQEAVQALQSAAAEKHLTLLTHLPPGAIPWQGHRDSLVQVMTSILSNAVKFTPPNGRVEVRLESNDREIMLTVSDTGPGIPEEMQNRVFDRFQAASRQVMEQGQGTGLSLALARYITEYHQGRIGVKSQPGQGSQFYFHLPLHDSSKAEV